MRLGLVVMLAVAWIGSAQAEDMVTGGAAQLAQMTVTQPAPEEAAGGRYLRVCALELASRNLPASASDCEKLLERSHLVQSDAIRYLAQANDKERESFGAMSTLGRYEIVESDVDPVSLVLLLLGEKETAAPGMVVQLAQDVMKSSCGYYQIDIIMKALSDASAHPLPSKRTSGKSVNLAYKSCIGVTLQDGKVSDCLNPVFQSVTSEPSPNP